MAGKVGIRSAGDHARLREFRGDGHTITLADTSARLDIRAVGFRLRLPDAFIHTVLEFIWHERLGSCDLEVKHGPVWVSRAKDTRGRRKKLGHGDHYQLEFGDLIHLTDRSDDVLTIELYRESAQAQVDSYSVPKAARKEPEELKPGDILPGEPEEQRGAIIEEAEPDVDPKGFKRKWEKRWRDFKNTYYVPWRKRWAEVKYWQGVAKSTWRAAMGLVSMAAGLMGLVALWNFIDTGPKFDPLDPDGGEVSSYLAPQEESLKLQVGLQRMAPGKFDKFTHEPGAGFVKWSKWDEGVAKDQLPHTAWTSLAEEASGALDRVGSLLDAQYPVLVGRWCAMGTRWAPLRDARLQAQKSTEPAQWLLAYGPAVRTQYCPMYNDDRGRLGWTGSRLEMATSAERRASAKRLGLGGVQAASVWLQCGLSDGRLSKWAGLLQGKVVDVTPGAPAPILALMRPKLLEARSEEYDAVVVDLATKAAQHSGAKVSVLDRYLFALWRHDQGDEKVMPLLKAMTKDPAVARHCKRVKCLPFLQARRWAIDKEKWDTKQTDFPLEVLAWYVLFEQRLLEDGKKCGPVVAH